MSPKDLYILNVSKRLRVMRPVSGSALGRIYNSREDLKKLLHN